MARSPAVPGPGRQSQKRHDVHNPFGPQGRDLAEGGGPFHPSPQSIERGTVISVDARRATHRVALNNGTVLNGIAKLRSSVGDVAILPTQTTVAVMFGLGEPYILGVLPPQAQEVSDEVPDNITGTTGHGGEDPVLNRNMGAVARTAGEPRDLLPGDAVIRSPDGAAVGALHGKLALLRGGPLAQIRAHGNEDILEVIGGVMRFITWMGESQYVNNNGKTSFIWRGGADQLTESGSDENAYTVRLDVGDTGDLVNFEVTTPAGQSLFRFHVSTDGRMEIVARGGFDWVSGADRQMANDTHIQGEQTVEVQGTRTLTVASDVTETLGGNRTTSVSTNDNLSVGQDHILRINRDQDFNVGGDLTYAATGKVALTAAQGDMTQEITQGKFTSHVAVGEYHITADQGDLTLEANGPKLVLHNDGNVDLIPASGDLANIGGTSGQFSLMGEDFQNYVKQQIKQQFNQFLQDYGIHAHSGTAGPYPIVIVPGPQVPTEAQSLPDPPDLSSTVKIQS